MTRQYCANMTGWGEIRVRSISFKTEWQRKRCRRTVIYQSLSLRQPWCQLTVMSPASTCKDMPDGDPSVLQHPYVMLYKTAWLWKCVSVCVCVAGGYLTIAWTGKHASGSFWHNWRSTPGFKYIFLFFKIKQTYLLMLSKKASKWPVHWSRLRQKNNH